ncbi:MAG: hypothetical protein KIT22_17750, partial [Verrucomicrobiae bacterium]|nr:hypothetical protein [Verrucomicrobiae bacterium]
MKRRVFPWLSLAFALVGLGAEIFQVNDRLRVRFLGATEGTHHVAPGQHWRQWYRRSPAWVKNVMGRLLPDSAAPVVSYISEEPVLNLWFWDASPSNRSGLLTPLFQHRSEV